MKSVLLTPTFLPQLTGNAVTVDRISRLLSQGGVTCRIVNLSETDERAASEAVRTFQPDVIHAFHAYKGGRCGLAIRKMTAVPLITTITGTDVYVDIRTASKRGAILRVLEESDHITVFNEQARSVPLNHGIDRQKISVIHQSVFFPEKREVDYRAHLNIDREATVFLFLGGIRKIKRLSLALPVLEEARRKFRGIHLIIAGPVIEREEFQKIEAWYAGKPWVTYLGEVPREDVPALLTSIDVLLNTSSSESEADAVLEAMSCRKIVIARDIPRNASLITGATGFLFRDREELREKIIHALAHKNDWDHVGKQAQQFIERSFSPAREQAEYLAVYKKCATAPVFHHPTDFLEKTSFFI